jgi:sulfotransferase family protein
VTRPQVRVTYIAGAGRSGSTLLAMMLGTLPGWVSVGELRHLWARGVQENQLCGCGEPFLSCPFWNAVGQVAFDGWERSPHARMRDLQPRVDRFRRLPTLLTLRWSAERRRMADEYAGTMASLYRAIADVSGAGMIVDSSKSATFAMLLARMRDTDAHVLHLVRDSRAVAHSWMRRRRMPEVGEREAYMATFTPGASARVWAGNNLAVDLIGALGRLPTTRLRYELLVRGDEDEWRLLQAALGLDDAEVAGLRRPEIPLTVQHTVAGNPSRFARDRILLKPDDEWRGNMAAADRRRVELLTWPLLVRYGYPVRT